MEDVPSNSRTFEFVLERRNFLVFLLSKVCNGDFGLKSALIRRKNAKILLSGAAKNLLFTEFIECDICRVSPICYVSTICRMSQEFFNCVREFGCYTLVYILLSIMVYINSVFLRVIREEAEKTDYVVPLYQDDS